MPEPSMPTLTDAEREALTAFSSATRSCPSTFLDARQVFPLYSEALRTTVHHLCEAGYLERQPSASGHYRLTPRGWQVLGMKVVKIDLSKF